jgi:zinc transporter ZupT
MFEQVVFARALAAMLVASAGALFAVGMKKLSHHALCAMISVAAGALFSVTLVEILPEAAGLVRPLELVLGFASGYALFYLVSRYIYHICPACAATHTEERFIAVNYLMISAISLHSMMDGIGVAVSYQTGDDAASIAILLAVSIHKFPEGLALASVARAAGYSRKKALAVAVAVESTTLIGGLLSVFLLNGIPLFWYGIILAHIGGGFVYITAHAMIGEMVKHERKSILAYAVLGFALILVLSLALGAAGV